MVDSKKVANNILDFLIDPTRVPVKDRVYFRDEEILRNESYEKAKADACQAFKDQKHNSDFYPQKNRSLINREATIVMDRKTLIASLDVLSKNFKNPSDPIAADLTIMAQALSKMSDEELTPRLASEAPDLETVLAAETFKCPECGTKVLKQTGYCVKCKKKVKEANEEVSAAEEIIGKVRLDKKKVLDALSGATKQDAQEALKLIKGLKDASEMTAGLKMNPALAEAIKKGTKAGLLAAMLMAAGVGSAFAGAVDTIAKGGDIKAEIIQLERGEESIGPAISRAQAIFDEAQAPVSTEMAGPSHPAPAAPDTVKIRAAEDFWTKEASEVVAQALVSEIIGVVADDDEDEDKPAKKAPADVPAAPAEVKVPADAPEKKEEEKKEAGKIKGPGVPDGTGPMSGTPACPLSEKKEEKKEEAPVQAKVEEKPAPVVKEVPVVIPPEPGTKEAVVDTDILASVTFAGIEVPTGIMSMDDVGEMSDQEKANLAQLF
jgi:predicted RNA-binding Zn-ribbon protein involved in translation (DUF1610 family)